MKWPPFNRTQYRKTIIQLSVEELRQALTDEAELRYKTEHKLALVQELILSAVGMMAEKLPKIVLMQTKKPKG